MAKRWMSPRDAVLETMRSERLQDEAESHAERERFRYRVYGDGDMVVEQGPAGGKPRRPIDPTVQRIVEWSDRRMIDLGWMDPPAPAAVETAAGTQLTLGLEGD